MTGMGCAIVEDCDRAATVALSGGTVVLLTCDLHARTLLAAAGDRGELTIRHLRRPPADPPHQQPA